MGRQTTTDRQRQRQRPRPRHWGYAFTWEHVLCMWAGHLEKYYSLSNQYPGSFISCSSYVVPATLCTCENWQLLRADDIQYLDAKHDAECRKQSHSPMRRIRPGSSPRAHAMPPCSVTQLPAYRSSQPTTAAGTALFDERTRLPPPPGDKVLPGQHLDLPAILNERLKHVDAKARFPIRRVSA